MSSNFSQLRVLVLDDNTYMCRIVQTILTSFGVEKVIVATDGNTALEHLRKDRIDIAIIDHLMKPVDGLEFTRMIRTVKDSPNPDLPILMMTAYTERHRIERAIEAGVNTLLAKPFTPAELYRRVVFAITTPPGKCGDLDLTKDGESDEESIVYL